MPNWPTTSATSTSIRRFNWPTIRPSVPANATSLRETLEKTRLSFDSTRERFNLGRATQADYEQAKNNLFKTEISRIQSRYEYLMRQKILMFYANPRNI